MNIFQKKINKQAKYFMKYHNKFWNSEDNMSFRVARIDERINNKEDRVSTIELMNKEIECLKNALIELEEERKES